MKFLTNLDVTASMIRQTNNSDIVSSETAFRKITSNSTGFFIWKVENDRTEALQKENYGIFYDYCAYIIYAVSAKGSSVTTETINREAKSNVQLQKYIHFWLGSQITADKSGSVAYKIIELDNQLGNTAAQYRETQENESCRFLSYFKDGIIILSAQCEHQKCRLYRVYGKKSAICIERTTVNWSHFNSSFLMLLQTEKNLFVWVGRSSSSSERLNALKLAEKLKQIFKIPEVAIVDDGYEQSLDEQMKQNWNKYLPLQHRAVQPLFANVNDDVSVVLKAKLYKCGFQNSKYRIEEIKSAIIQQSDLNDHHAAYIVDCGSANGVWIWLGKHSEAKDKSEAMRNARGFVKKKKYSSTTTVVRVVDGYEPIEFINIFPSWQASIAALSIIDRNGGNIVNKSFNNFNNSFSILGKFDFQTLLQRPQLASTTQLIDDGTGDMTVYRMKDKSFFQMPKTKNVAIFSNDCYLIHYVISVADNNLMPVSTTIRHILYLWTGSQCSADARYSGQILATEFFTKLQKNIMQIRVNDGWEPPHFLQMFRGKLIVFNGKATDNNKHPSNYILKVTGNASYNSRAQQISVNDSEFLTTDCLLLKNLNDEIWVWCGQSSTGDAREIAKKIAGTLGEYALALESNEPEEFWQCLPYNFQEKIRAVQALDKSNSFFVVDPRQFTVDLSKICLYICSIEQENILIKQIMAFKQSDLMPEDIYLLDIGTCIYVWIGLLSSIEEKVKSWEMASYFLNNYLVAHHRSAVPVAIIQQEAEPIMFIGFFIEWNSKFWETHRTFDAQRLLLEAKPNGHSSTTVVSGNNNFDKYPKFPVAALREEADLLPECIDPKRKEIHLTNDDFVAVFNMKFEEFEKLPNWRKQELKKKYKLF